MPSPFQKYQGEQVQEIPAGYLESMANAAKMRQQGMASIAQGISQAGSAIAGGITEKYKMEQEEAKLQGALSPYLRNDPRTKAIEDALSTGLLKKDAAGNVIIPDESKDRFNIATATSAIDFYNQTGGDGSKLKGADLTKFASQFEAQQKYQAVQDAKEDKRIERLKTLAEIDKLNAESASKFATVQANKVVAGYAAGETSEVSAVPATAPSPTAVPATGFNLPTVKDPTYDYTQPSAPTAIGGSTPMPGFSVDRYNAGTTLAGQFRTAPSEAAPVVTTPKQEAPKTPVTLPLPKPISETGPVTDVIALAGVERQVQTQKYQDARTGLNADYARAMVSLQKTGGATPEAIKVLNETLKIRLENLDNNFKANIDLIDKRVTGATTVASEKRAGAAEVRADKADTRAEATLDIAKSADARAVAEGKMKQEEFDMKYGKPLTVSPERPESSRLPAGTFKRKQAEEREKASNVPGRTGGTFGAEQEQKVADRQNEMKSRYPANWSLGLFHDGAKEYQFDLQNFPTATAVAGANVGKVQELFEGYAASQAFALELNKVVESTDPDAVRNYLNRFLPTATKDAKNLIITGEMMQQFGVAANRRGIVSGGNFSDADRTFVAKLITDINSINPLKDKALFLAQTKALATFLDSKYKSELASYGVRFDTGVAREFLKREGDTAGLKQLAKTEEYIKTFGIDQPSSVASPDYVQNMRNAISNATAAGNTSGAKMLTQQLDKYLAELDRKEEAAKAARKNANK